MHAKIRNPRMRPELAWIVGLAAACGAAMAASRGFSQPAAPGPHVAGVPIPGSPRSAPAVGPQSRAGQSLPWRLNNPAPNLVPESLANPFPVADKLAARVRSMEERASLRAYEGAPPVIPHPIAGLNVQTCRACHANGLRAGDKVARMVSHAYLTNCTQCHVEADVASPGDPAPAANAFTGLRPSGYGGTRAWAGAPPVVPHTTFMRTNCVSCHGEHGYNGWRPDHLSRTNCVQCHALAAEFDQLAPTFGTPDVPDGQARLPLP